MRDLLHFLVSVGEWAVPAVWLPVLAWTAAALLAEAALRFRPHPLLALGARRSLLWALPVGVIAALVLPDLLPPAAIEQVVAFRPQAVRGLVLPTIEVGVVPDSGGSSPAPVALVPLVAGLGLLAAMAVAFVRLGRVLSGVLRLRQLSVGAASDAVQRETAEAARAAGVTRAVRAVATDVPTVPFTFGWRQPVVVVPAGLAEDAGALRLILAHEVAHVARGDFAAGVAERLLTALFGWHPLVGALARQIDLDRERATDAAVLAGHPSSRRDYASLLLSFSRLPSPALALGAAPGSDSLTTRITDMKRSPLPTERLRQISRSARIVGLALFLAAVGVATFVAIGPTQTRALAATLDADAIQFASPVVTIDGVAVFEGEGTISSTEFGVATIAVGSWGRFLVSDQPFEGASPAGSFGLDRIQVQAGGHTLQIDIEAPPFAERRERRAYALFDGYPGAAPLAQGDARIGDVWFSVASHFTDPMPVLETYRNQTLYDVGVGEGAMWEEAGEALDEMDEEMDELDDGSRIVIEGRVVDAVTGRPLVGANVVVVGTARGAATDREGRFVLTGVDPGDAQVRITFVGYQPLTVVPQTGEVLEIGLVPENADRMRELVERTREQAARASEIDPDAPNAPDVFVVVEDPPELIGGNEGLLSRISYPRLAINAGIEGTVYVQFVVNAEGAVEEATCIRSPDEMLCAAALEAVNASSFEPGRQRGKAVKVWFTLPVRFALPTEDE